MEEAIYETAIFHSRTKPALQRFTVHGYSLFVDVNRFDGAGNPLRLLGFAKRAWHRLDRANFSLLAGPGKTASACALDFLKSRTGIRADRVFLLAHPAIAGYIFNPVSFFFYYRGGEHVATVAEVNNTFGEQKHFVLTHGGKQQQQKIFYVSPFISPFADFVMQLPAPAEKLHISIDTVRSGDTELVARMNGKRFPLTDAQLLKFAFKYPFYTVKVIVLIHYFALRLFLKGVRHFPKQGSDAAIIHTDLRSLK